MHSVPIQKSLIVQLNCIKIKKSVLAVAKNVSSSNPSLSDVGMFSLQGVSLLTQRCE